MSGSLDTRLKQEVFARDNYRCRWCGRTRSWQGFDAHHIRFRRGVSDDVLDNLITLCRYCHDWIHANRIPKEQSQRVLRALLEQPGRTGMALLRAEFNRERKKADA